MEEGEIQSNCSSSKHILPQISLENFFLSRILLNIRSDLILVGHSADVCNCVVLDVTVIPVSYTHLTLPTIYSV